MTHLTDREREVVELVGGGAQYATVGSTLGISKHTVREHVRRIAAKVNGGRSPRETVIALYHRQRVTVDGTTAEGDW